jgi:DDE superfamily endonuclease
MEDAKQLWSVWQRNLQAFRPAFTRPGWVRFAQWATAMVLCDEEHTVTQAAASLGLPQCWRAWEYCAEYAAWDAAAVERAVMGLVEREHRCRFGRYRPAAVDDTKAMRSSRRVWGACTYKHVSRNPRHPKLLTGHNWVVMGELCPGGGAAPWTYLPEAARLYLREAQLPPGETFRTKNELAVEMLRELDAESDAESESATVLAVFDGGYARAKVVRPCLGEAPNGPAGGPGPGPRRIEILTRPRSDARLYAPLPPPGRKGKGKKGGRPRKWGRRLPPPREHAKWRAPWREGRAWVYGRRRKFRCKCLECRWAVSGPDEAVRVFAFEVEGYDKPWYVVTSAADLSAAQVLEAYAARFRQEDGIRDHKQRMGMEQVRAWTKAPVLRTFLVQLVAITLLRLLGRELERTRGPGWCPPPPWNPRKTRASILDLRRVLWRCRTEFSQFTRELEEVQKPPSAAA